MTPTEAAKLLDLPPDATPEQLEARFLELRRKLEDKIAKAPTPGLKAKYRDSLSEITTAFESLTLAADTSDLPVLQRAAKVERVVPNALSGNSPLPAPSSPPPARKSNREFLLVAIIAVVVFAAGGWFILKTRAGSAERANVEAAAKAEAETEKARQESQFSALRAAQAEAKIRWETVERELSAAERRLSELKSDQRNAEKLPATDQAEMKARLAAQTDYVEWLQPQLARHPARTLLARLDALLSTKALAEAATAERELTTGLTTLETEVAAQRASLLALGKTIRFTSEPAGLNVQGTDAYGRNFSGTTPAAVSLPWGAAQVTVSSPGKGWADTKRTLRIGRDSETEVKASFALSTAQITSTPSGLAYTLTNPAGLSRRGTTPADLKDVPTGSATLKVSRPAWPDIEQAVEIAAGQPNAFTAEFAPGSLTLTSEPAGATVLANDKPVGTTPLTLENLLPGEHTYRLKLKGYGTASVSGQVRAKATAQASARLERIAQLEAGKPYRVPELGLELMPIAAGRFTMGSPESEVDRQSNEKQHQVTLSQPYWLGKYEVTQAEWQAVMGRTLEQERAAAEQYWAEREAAGGRGLPVESCKAMKEQSRKVYGEGDTHPIYYVSWDAAISFCRKLTARERAAERLPAGYEYTLPTEAQWEYACRAGTSGPYAGSGGLYDMGWYKDNSDMKTHPVGQKQANAWGLYDMHGNVWEWCADWYASYDEGSVRDPAGPTSGTHRVLRGGSFADSADFCRSACRGGNAPVDRGGSLGFRLALSSSRGTSQ